MYYLSALIATVGTVGYHNLVKKIPAAVDPMVSVIAIYVGVLVLGVVMLPVAYSGGRIAESMRQLGWVQIGIAVCIVLMELGFILMYRSGWKLSVGNVVTGVVINLALMIIGLVFLKEKLSVLNMLGVLFCIVGVTMIGFRPEAKDEPQSGSYEPMKPSVEAGIQPVGSAPPP